MRTVSDAAAGAVAFALVSLLATAGCTSRSIVRLVDGEPVGHRAISVRAYGAYARGAVAEAAGAYTVALAEYTLATDVDDAGVEPWTRRGAVACVLGHAGDAAKAFAEAESRDATFEPLWTERARCALAHGDPKDAVASAERAEALDPDSDDAVLVHAQALEKTGDVAAALRELVALATRHPTPTAFRAEMDLAARAGDEPTRRAAERSLRAALGGDEAVPPKADLASLDALLAEGDVREAERAGRRLGLAPSDLAVRAAALGHYDVARKIADPIVRANPRDADALIASLAARKVDDMTGLDDVLVKTHGRTLTTPSPLAVLVLSEVLLRRIGPEALEGMSFDTHATDEVARALAVRLSERK